MTAAEILAAATLAFVCVNALAKPVEVRLEISADGRYALQGRPVALSDLRARLLDLKAAHPGIELHVRGSDKLSYSQLAPVMKLVEEVGLAPRALILAPSDSTASAAKPSGDRR